MNSGSHQEEARDGFSLGTSRRNQLGYGDNGTSYPYRDKTFGPLASRIMSKKICGFKPLSLGYFVTEAIGNKYKCCKKGETAPALSQFLIPRGLTPGRVCPRSWRNPTASQKAPFSSCLSVVEVLGPQRP